MNKRELLEEYKLLVRNSQGANCTYCTDDCYSCIGCNYCHSCHNCYSCHSCIDCYDCRNCTDCANCLLCVNLEGKREGYWLLNKEVSEGEFNNAKNNLT